MDDTKSPIPSKEDLARDHLADAMDRLSRVTSSSQDNVLLEGNPLEPEVMPSLNTINETQVDPKKQVNLDQVMESDLHSEQKEDNDAIQSAQTRLEIQTQQKTETTPDSLNSEKSPNAEKLPLTAVLNREAHIAKIIKDVKDSSPATTFSGEKTPIAKTGDWLTLISKEERPQTCLKLIMNKGKNIDEVVKAFLELNDLSGLDSLESLLAQNYENLLYSNILNKI